jgi:hypothetical protein
VANHRRRKRYTDLHPFHIQRPRTSLAVESDATIVDRMPVSILQTSYRDDRRRENFGHRPANSNHQSLRRYHVAPSPPQPRRLQSRNAASRTLISLSLFHCLRDCRAAVISRDSSFSSLYLLLRHRKLSVPSSTGRYSFGVTSILRGGESITEGNTSRDTSDPLDGDDDDAQLLDESYLKSLIENVDMTSNDGNDILDNDNDDVMIKSIMKKMSGRKKLSRKIGHTPILNNLEVRDINDDGLKQAVRGIHDDDHVDVSFRLQPGDDAMTERKDRDAAENVQAENIEADAVISDSNQATDLPNGDTRLSIENQVDDKYSVLPREQLLQSPVIRPNAIYRFLLRQGSIGHILVILFVLVGEWFSLYVPPLTNFVSMLIARIFPQSAEDDYLYHRPMKKLSRKERILQTKYDDEVALQQLKGLDKKSAKYRYVSDDFLRRHELGPYSKTKVKSLSDITSLMVKEQKGRKSKETLLDPKVNDFDRAKNEDDFDWVVEALTVEKDLEPRPFLQPSISIGSSSKSGASIGIEFGFGSTTPSDAYDRRNVLARAVAADERRRRLSVRPREKSSNGSTAKDSILDKFRDLTGTDSAMLSRSLLGAYPGDAVSIQDAASPDGVMELARKYGWGEWSEDDEEKDIANLNSDELKTVRRKKTRRRTKLKTETQSPDDFDFDDFTSPPSPELSKSRLSNVRQRKSMLFASSPSGTRDSRDERRVPSEDSFPVSPILERGNRLADPNKNRNVQRMIRPATELLTDRREQLLTKLNEKHRTTDE